MQIKQRNIRQALQCGPQLNIISVERDRLGGLAGELQRKRATSSVNNVHYLNFISDLATGNLHIVIRYSSQRFQRSLHSTSRSVPLDRSGSFRTQLQRVCSRLHDTVQIVFLNLIRPQPANQRRQLNPTASLRGVLKRIIW